jgi:hypothetical protein
VTFDDDETWTKKAEWANRQCLGGVFGLSGPDAPIRWDDVGTTRSAGSGAETRDMMSFGVSSGPRTSSLAGSLNIPNVSYLFP